jgi:hypothetical protein
MGITKKSFYRDPEVIFILLYNTITLFSFYFGELQPMYVVWAFYLQSLYIGAKYWFLEIFTQFRSEKKQWFMTFFFPMHYGGFHLAYFVFLLIMSSGQYNPNLRTFLLLNLLVLAGQFIIFLIREVSSSTPYHKPVFFFAPYIRVIPMHIIIILGFKANNMGINAFYIFIILKTLVDLVSFSWFDRKEIQEGISN